MTSSKATTTSGPTRRSTCSVYPPSSRPYRGLPDIDYSLHDKAATVTTCGRICFNNQRSISVRCSPARPSASSKLTTAFGWSASRTMISATSTTRPAGSPPLQTPSTESVTYVFGIKRNPCVRNGLIVRWSGQLDSNQRPAVPKTAALPGCAIPRSQGRSRRYTLRNPSARRDAWGAASARLF
jgi:hypothetical protein